MLSVGENEIGDEGAQHLADALQQNEVIASIFHSIIHSLFHTDTHHTRNWVQSNQCTRDPTTGEYSTNCYTFLSLGAF
jgi:hypothetical protein